MQDDVASFILFMKVWKQIFSSISVSLLSQTLLAVQPVEKRMFLWNAGMIDFL